MIISFKSWNRHVSIIVNFENDRLRKSHIAWESDRLLSASTWMVLRCSARPAQDAQIGDCRAIIANPDTAPMKCHVSHAAASLDLKVVPVLAFESGSGKLRPEWFPVFRVPGCAERTARLPLQSRAGTGIWKTQSRPNSRGAWWPATRKPSTVLSSIFAPRFFNIAGSCAAIARTPRKWRRTRCSRYLKVSIRSASRSEFANGYSGLRRTRAWWSGARVSSHPRESCRWMSFFRQWAAAAWRRRFRLPIGPACRTTSYWNARWKMCWRPRSPNCRRPTGRWSCCGIWKSFLPPRRPRYWMWLRTWSRRVCIAGVWRCGRSWTGT